MPNPRSKPHDVVSYGPSKTIPGQSLKPSELLKRHLAGTLPPIDLSKRYEYHYDETGKQVAEPLPLELSEIHRLSVAIRKQEYEKAMEARKLSLEKHRLKIIDEYEKEQAAKKQSLGSEPPSAEGGKTA